MDDVPDTGEPQAAAAAPVGRNDPCPCGSGKKYKHCHLAEDAQQRRVLAQTERGLTNVRGTAPLHARDQRLKLALLQWGRQRFGGDALPGRADFRDPDAAADLAIPWGLFTAPIEGRPLVEWFAEERGDGLQDADYRWLRAQQAAWLSVREVVSVVEGLMVEITDLLTGHEEGVIEGTASRTLVARDAVLARTVKHEDQSVFAGVHPRVLGPLEAAEVVRRVRARFRLGPHASLEQLRDPAVGRHLIACWEEAVEALDRRSAKLPELRNTDGDALLLTTDHFAFDPARRSEVATRLAAIEGAEPPGADDPDQAYGFVRRGRNPAGPPGETIVAIARLDQGGLDVETTSVRRADDIRRRIEAACEGMLRHRAREHADPLALVREGAEPGRSRRPGRGASPGRRGMKGAAPSEAASPDVAAALLEFKQRYYADWLDQPIPMLGGKTPRQAVRTARGRAQVDALLKVIENGEARLAPGAGLDLRPMRRELGLED